MCGGVYRGIERSGICLPRVEEETDEEDSKGNEVQGLARVVFFLIGSCEIAVIAVIAVVIGNLCA